jgi:hypothetical protein
MYQERRKVLNFYVVGISCKLPHHKRIYVYTKADPVHHQFTWERDWIGEIALL